MAGLGHKKKFCFDLIFVSIFFRDCFIFYNSFKVNFRFYLDFCLSILLSLLDYHQLVSYYLFFNCFMMEAVII